MEDVDEMISSMSTQNIDREVVEKEFVNLVQHYQHISDSFAKLVNEVPHMKKWQLATHITNMPILPLVKVTTKEKVSSMYGQRYTASEASSMKVTEEFYPKVYGTMDEERIQSVQNTTGDCATLLLLAIGNCVANNRSQAEVAKKYEILKSRIQRMMSSKKEHKKGGKQYWQEKKRRTSEEGSVQENKAKRSEPKITEVKIPQTLEPEKEEEKESSSDELSDVQL